ncbi:unnamed protein product [Caenorhabditis auriculariae]|uniref:Tyrosine aminotransferase n=1 Tax=Caenorhabditis auriculariae TaxID=2777116 RepID=A0A8S1H1Q7_9PELO|nr:unnamed protein product [Caenorhabditis auriculariae]
MLTQVPSPVESALNLSEIANDMSPITKRQIDAELFLHEIALLHRQVSRKSMDWRTMPQSAHSRNTVNPVRKIADACQVTPNPNKRLLKLHLGDPSVGGMLPPSPVAVQAMHEAVDSHAFDGYGPAVGDLAARQAVVDRYSVPSASFTADDVILASGCSHALQMAIEAIAGPGDSILVPHPGFPLYSTLCRPHGIVDRAYHITMTDGVRIDLNYLESLIDETTKAIIVNNPGNPTGAVFTKEHLQEILRVAHKHRLVIIADEIYGDLVYNGAEFHPIATLSPKVPVLTCDGIAKRWMVPGWRLGWVIVHDRYKVLSQIKLGMVALSQKIVGPCALVQGALPKILKDTPEEYFVYTRNVIQENANAIAEVLEVVPGLTAIKPQGAMYMMIGVDKATYGDDVGFCQALIREESVFCLPGQAFSAPGYFRIVLTSNLAEMREAAERIRDYCLRHIGECRSEDSSDEGCELGSFCDSENDV